MINGLGRRKLPQHRLEYNIEPETEAEKALHQALVGRFREILEKPLTARSLVELSQMAETARTLLVIGKVPGQMLPGPKEKSIFDLATQVVDPMGYEGAGEILGSNYYGALEPSPPAETFGATAIRELVSALGEVGKKKESSSELVLAIAEARKHGLSDVAKTLESKLYGKIVLDVIKEESGDLHVQGAPDGARCPRCNSSSPRLHPAVQCEGEVEVCPHEFHGGAQKAAPAEVTTSEAPPAPLTMEVA